MAGRNAPLPVEVLAPAAPDFDLDTVRDAFERTGLVLLRGRGFDLAGFEAISRVICAGFHQVGTRQALKTQGGDGFNTEVFRDNFILLGHSEGAYRPSPPPPDVCFFMCIAPPAVAGGETTLVDGASMLALMPGWLRERLEREGITYECLWQPSRWQAEFGVSGEADLVALLAGLPGCRFALKEGLLHLFYSTPAIGRARDGRPVFANGVLAHLPRIDHPRYSGRPVYAKASNRVYFGNGELLSDEVVNILIDLHDGVKYRHRWQANDVLIVDNARYMHGREMTAEPCERVLVSRFGHRS